MYGGAVGVYVCSMQESNHASFLLVLNLTKIIIDIKDTKVMHKQMSRMGTRVPSGPWGPYHRMPSASCCTTMKFFHCSVQRLASLRSGHARSHLHIQT